MKDRSALRRSGGRNRAAFEIARLVTARHIAIAVRAFGQAALRGLRRLLEDAKEDAIAKRGQPQCRAGCAACCSGPIPVTPAEVAVIRPLVTDDMRARARAVAELADDDPRIRWAPCPALDPVMRVCTIYAERPMVCRSHVSWSDPRECEPGGSGAGSDDQVAAFTLAALHAEGQSYGNDLVLLADVMAEP